MRRPDPGFWRGRRVLVTGHTGFKGAWLSLMLAELGAAVTGVALEPEPGPSLFRMLGGATAMTHHGIDVRDRDALAAAVRSARPSVVFHLAAQALVRRSYRTPADTFAINVAGTANLLEALRRLDGLEAIVVVTSDKVYRNDGSGRHFREGDPLGGDDPYSASKAAQELVAESWRSSFGSELPPLATARAGNVIGGGDFSEDRLVPDIVRALAANAPLRIRYPQAVRPWQYVLDVLAGYLLFAERLARGESDPPALNFGPLGEEPVTVSDVIAAFAAAFGEAPAVEADTGDVPPEAPRLALDPSLAVRTLDWQPRFDAAAAIAETARWYARWRGGEDMACASKRAVMEMLG